MNMIKIVLVALIVLLHNTVLAQNNNGQAVQLAQKIAKKMKDSLDLTGAQRNKVFEVNMEIHNEKQTARTQFAGNNTQISNAVQAAENKRDGKYKLILNTGQYAMYLQKKRNLINNN